MFLKEKNPNVQVVLADPQVRLFSSCSANVQACSEWSGCICKKKGVSGEYPEYCAR